jgi:hypothetical protein
MTDRELHLRYGKMKKKDKIDTFYKVLKKVKRCPTLQKKIKRDISSGTIILYKLYNHKLAKEVFYKVDNSQTCLQVEIVSYHNGDLDDKTLFDISDARKDWDIKCNSGFVPTELEDHLKSTFENLKSINE